MTEVWHADADSFQRQIAARQALPARDIIDADEARLMDRGRKVFVVLDECGGGPAEPDGAVRKLLRFVRAPTGWDSGLLKAVCEERLARNPGGGANHRRNYALSRTPQDSPPQFDLLEEFWLAVDEAPPALDVKGARSWEVSVVEHRSLMSSP